MGKCSNGRRTNVHFWFLSNVCQTNQLMCLVKFNQIFLLWMHFFDLAPNKIPFGYQINQKSVITIQTWFELTRHISWFLWVGLTRYDPMNAKNMFQEIMKEIQTKNWFLAINTRRIVMTISSDRGSRPYQKKLGRSAGYICHNSHAIFRKSR